MTARLALAGNPADWHLPGHPAQPPAWHPYLIMNSKSGGGKVEKFDLKRKAEGLGADVFLVRARSARSRSGGTTRQPAHTYSRRRSQARVAQPQTGGK
jgi:hypothetical protein